MPAHPIRLLLVEDDPADAHLVDDLLRRKDTNAFHLTRAATMAEALGSARRQDFDVALLDLSLPDAFGLEALERLLAFRPLLPVVVLTGNDDEALALAAVQQGAQDYLVKGHDDQTAIARAIHYAIERAGVEASLRRSESRFRAVFENAGLGIGLIDIEARVFSANPALTAMLGYDPVEKGGHLADAVHPDDRTAILHLWREMLEGRRDRASVETRFLTANQTNLWGRVNLSLVASADGRPQFIVGMVENISAHKALEEQLRLAAKVLEATSEGVFVTDAEAHIVHVNPAFSRLTGYEPEEVLGQTPALLSSGRQSAEFYAAMWRALREEGYWRGEIWNRRKSGELFAEWLNVSAVKNDHGTVDHYVAVFSDITSRKQSEARLSHQAHHDPLTELPNRALFVERLDRALARAERNRLALAVLFLDLDHFKDINDSLGHLAGDALLQQVAERLHRTVRREDTVARLGGDEFTILVEDVSDFRDAATVARKVLRRFGPPFRLGGHARTVTTSIGISLYPGDGITVEALLHQADEAMYVAKKQGRDTFRFASAGPASKAFERRALEAALGRAVEHGEMDLFYQPLVRLKDGNVAAVEALLRWRHPEIGLMVPGQFLPLAIETGLIRSIDRWALAMALSRMQAWRASGLPLGGLAVNVSGPEMADPALGETVARLMAETGLPADTLWLDLPAAAMGKADGPAVRLVAALRARGTKVALDNFGAAEAEFAFLRQARVDGLKIAAELVRGIGTSTDDERAIGAILALARDRDITVTAKGVETVEQSEFLSHLRCEQAQGYLFSRPVPADELPGVLRTREMCE